MYVFKVPNSKFFLQIVSRAKCAGPLPRKEVEFPGLQFGLKSDGLAGKESWGPRGVVGSWRSGESIPQGLTPPGPPAQRPWHVAQ